MTSKTTLLFDSTDLSSITGIYIADWGPLMAPMTRRGSHDTVANRDGWLGAELPLGGYNFDLHVVLLGDTEGEWFTNLTSLASALAGTAGLGTLERRIDDDATTMDGYTAAYASGAFGGLNLTTLNSHGSELDLTFANLSGGWFSDTALTTPVPI